MSDFDNVFFEDQEFVLNLPYHLAQAGMGEYFCVILTDFEFLQHKLLTSEVQTLIEDYDFINQFHLLNHVQLDPSKIKILSLIKECLSISAHILNENKNQLISQLWGRLSSFKELTFFLKQAKQNIISTCLIPYNSNFTSPNEGLIRIFYGHQACITPDGEKIVYSFFHNILKVADLYTGKEFCIFTGHSDSINAICSSSDGKFVISGSKDKTIKVWDLYTGKEFCTFTGHSDSINAICSSFDGKFVISGSKDKTIKVWDLYTGKEFCTFTGHSDSINTISIRQFDNGQIIISGSNDKTIRIWDLEEKFWVKTLNFNSKVNNTLITKKWWISTIGIDTVIVNNLVTGESFSLYPENGAYSIAIISNKNQLLCGSSDPNIGTIQVFDLMTKQTLFSFQAHAGLVYSIVVTSNGKKIISTGPDYMVKVWDLDVISNQKSSNIEHKQLVEALAIIPNSNLVVSGSVDTSIIIWDYQTGEGRTYRHPCMYKEYSGVLTSTMQNQLQMKNWILSLAITSNGELISGLFSGKIRISNLLTFNSQKENRIKVTPNTFTDYEITVLEAQVELENELLLSGHTDGVFAIAVTSDGQKAISGSRDGTAIIWDLTTKDKLSTLEHYGEIYAIKITSNNKQVILGSGKNIEIFDLDTTVPQLTLKGHTSLVMSMAITPDEKQIISASRDGIIKIWDLATGQEEFSFLTGHQNILRTIDITPDGKKLISGSWDQTIKVWDLGSKKEITTLTVDGIVGSCIVSPEQTIIAGDSIGKVHFLRLEGID